VSALLGDTKISVQNVVGLIRLSSPPDVSIILKYVNGKKKKRFPGIIFKIPSLSITILVFKNSRNIVVTGATSIDMIYKATDKVINILQSINAISDVSASVTITNIVATGNFGRPINLLKMVNTIENIIFEPSVFPGVIHWRKNKVVFLIFANGKFVVTGARSMNQISKAVSELSDELRSAGVFYAGGGSGAKHF